MDAPGQDPAVDDDAVDDDAVDACPWAKAQMAMVIGHRRVPLAKTRLATDNGEFSDHWLADLTWRRKLPGGKTAQAHSIWHVVPDQYGKCPWQVPLVDEIKKAVSNLRVARNKQGLRFGANGKVLPGIVPVEVRGREILVENNVQGLRVALGDSLDTMNWFLKEVWNDMQTQNVPGVRRAPADSFKDLYMAESLEKLRAHKRIKNASYDVRYKRIRVGVHGLDKPMYRTVRRAHELLADEDMDGIEEFLAQTVDGIIGLLPDDPGEGDVAPLHGLHDPGEEGVADQGLHDPGEDGVADQGLHAPGEDGVADEGLHDPGEEGAAHQGLHDPGEDVPGEDVAVVQGLHDLGEEVVPLAPAAHADCGVLGGG